MSNREIAEIIFDKMRSFGFRPYDIMYGNGYFIFDFGEDSVVHFRVSGVPKHFKFGMWVDAASVEKHENDTDKRPEDRRKAARIFAQYDTCIDKFKPSRSDLCVEYDAYDWDETLSYPNGFWELESMLGFMRTHPLLAYHGFCGENAGYRSGSFLLSFLKYESWAIFKKIKFGVQYAIWLPYTKLKCFFARRSKIIDSLVLYDFDKDNPGWSTSYKFEVQIRFTAEATEDEETRWLHRWFRKTEYGKYGCFDHIVSVDSLQKVGREGRYVYTEGKDEE